jgi:hypothetical protein
MHRHSLFPSHFWLAATLIFDHDFICIIIDIRNYFLTFPISKWQRLTFRPLILDNIDIEAILTSIAISIGQPRQPLRDGFPHLFLNVFRRTTLRSNIGIARSISPIDIAHLFPQNQDSCLHRTFLPI